MPIILVGNNQAVWNDEPTRQELVMIKQEPAKPAEGKRWPRGLALLGVWSAQGRPKMEWGKFSEMVAGAALSVKCRKKIFGHSGL